jgi:hypothetical protein
VHARYNRAGPWRATFTILHMEKNKNKEEERKTDRNEQNTHEWACDK